MKLSFCYAQVIHESLLKMKNKFLLDDDDDEIQ